MIIVEVLVPPDVIEAKDYHTLIGKQVAVSLPPPSRVEWMGTIAMVKALPQEGKLQLHLDLDADPESIAWFVDHHVHDEGGLRHAPPLYSSRL